MKDFRGQLMVWCNAGVPSGRSWARPLETGLMLMLAAFFTNAETITLRPVADTSMHEIAPTFNMGGHTHVASGTTQKRTKSRGFFRFDLEGQIPPNATISSVSLVLTVTGTPPGGGAPSTFGLHRVSKEWGEGAKSGNTGSPAGTGEATWTARMSPSTPWSAPGGAPPEDFVGNASASAMVSNVGKYTFGPSTELLADVEFWRGNGGSNFGWILMSQAEGIQMTARKFGSRESGDSAASLVIDFTAPAVVEPPSITMQPPSHTVVAGASATFSVAARGAEPLTYQWRFNGVDIPGAIGATFNLNNVQPVAAGNYTVVVSNVAGSVISFGASLTVLIPPTISEQPQSQTVSAGSLVALRVVAAGAEPLTYQWRFNGVDIPGAIGATFSLNNVQPVAAGNYTVVVSDVAGSVISSEAAVTVLIPPGISEQPQSQTVSAGSLVTLRVVAAGAEPLTYQWRFNGVDIPGAIGATFSLNNVQPVAAGNYTVVVGNVVGSLMSADAALVVQTVPLEPPRIDRIEFDGEMLALVFTAPPSTRITVEFTEVLGNGVWMSLTTTDPGLDSVPVRITDSISAGKQRFYRLRIAE